MDSYSIHEKSTNNRSPRESRYKKHQQQKQRNKKQSQKNWKNTDINKSKLFNIKTGFMATEETEKYLLAILNDGKVERNSFINECAEDETRFSELSKRQK